MSGIVRYARWQAWDFAVDRGRPSLVVIALFWLQAWIALRGAPAGGAADGRAQLAALVLAQMVPLLGFVLALFAINGIVSADRTSGAFRLLLGKPVSAAAYYGQAFALHGLGAVVMGAVFLLGFALVAAPLQPVGALTYFALYYLLLGGLGFAMSTVARFDWASTAALWVGSIMVRSMLPVDRRWWSAVVDVVLPPTHALSAAGDALLAGAMPSLADAARVLGYGALAAGFAVVRLRRRPFDE
ncbi:MAG TPA: hypothetical protein VK922_11595 [Gemmatimonadaceae bacterium]|nr:hypothetical protein [Gemmatimonadaceae bacterium]